MVPSRSPCCAPYCSTRWSRSAIFASCWRINNASAPTLPGSYSARQAAGNWTPNERSYSFAVVYLAGRLDKILRSIFEGYEPDMKQFIEFIPLIVFFAVYKFYDIYTATGALVVVTGLQLIYSWVRYRKVEKMQLFTFLLVGFFGGLTVFFHDDAFIKWKVTVINILFALGLLISRYGFGKNLIKQMLGKELQAPDPVWDRVNL